MTKRTAATASATAVEPKLDTPPAETGIPASEESVMSETHTYADGSAVVGRPPWPEKSPLERAREAAESKG
ncbi:hypothetical protein J7E62_09270 [Variovorax paradoxus]|nr:hypothetical protein [Variovorax paradoxus]